MTESIMNNPRPKGPWSESSLEAWEKMMDEEIKTYLARHAGDAYDNPEYILGTAPWPPEDWAGY